MAACRQSGERNVESNEKPIMMTNCPANDFTWNRRYPKHLERSENCQSVELNEKPTVMVTDCPAIALTLTSFCEGAPPKHKILLNLSKEMDTRTTKICVRIFLAENCCSTRGADSTSTFSSGQCGSEEPACEFRRSREQCSSCRVKR